VKTPKSFAAALSQTRLPSVFNPYGDCCPVHDRPDAARVRKRNLVRCLEAALAARIDTIWIARDLGYRGGRRTGIPLTDEIHLSQAGVLLGGIALDRAMTPMLVVSPLSPDRARQRSSNQSMKPTAPLRCNFSVFATTPCRGLSLSR